MGYKIGYSGPKVDELLQKAFNSSVVNNGWVKYSSSENERCDLNTLKTQGNYSISFWNNAPVQLTTNGPINVSVTKDSADDTYYQTLYDAGKIYIRKTNEDGTFTNTWMELQSDTEIDFGSSTPINPKDNYVWIDTSGEVPDIKIFNEKTNTWISINPPDMAKESIYDPQGIKRDFNEFVNEKIDEADLASAADKYEKHLVDTNEDGTPIHVTEEEKAKWLSAVSQSTADSIMDEFFDEMSDLAISKINERSDYINGTLSDDINSLKSKIEDHINDASIHLTQEQVDLFDSKADKDHTHILDGSVTVSTSNITGLIPIERIDSTVIERCYSVNSTDEMLALTKTEVQNGDTVFIDSNSPTAWFVIDDSKLGTNDALDAFIQYAAPLPELTWENIKEKPTSLLDYGVDIYSQEEIDALYNKIKASLEETNTRTNIILDNLHLDKLGDEALTTIYKVNLNKAIALNKKLDYMILDMGLPKEQEYDLINQYKNRSVKYDDSELTIRKNINFNILTSDGKELDSSFVLPSSTTIEFNIFESLIYGKSIRLNDLTPHRIGDLVESADGDGLYELTGFSGDSVFNTEESEYTEEYVIPQDKNPDQDYF